MRARTTRGAILALLVALAGAGAAFGQEGDGQTVIVRAEPVGAKAPSRGRYPTVEAAAVAALRLAAHRHSRREFAGVVYRASDWSFAFTPPKRSRLEGRFELRLRYGIELPRDAEVVAIYHTHPRQAGARGDAHSPEDVAVARDAGLLSFIGVLGEDDVRVYDPNDPARAPADYPRGSHVGDVVGAL